MPAPVSALLVVATVLALAAPGEGAPAAAGAPAPIVLNFHHPEIVLGEPEMVESYGLTVRLPEGWVVEEDGDGIRFTAPGGVDGAGIALVVSAPLPDGGFEQVVASLAGEGVRLGARGVATIAGIEAPFVEVGLDLDEETRISQLVGVVPLDETVSLTLIASAREETWGDHRMVLEAILGSLQFPGFAAQAAEEAGFEALEGDRPSDS